MNAEIVKGTLFAFAIAVVVNLIIFFLTERVAGPIQAAVPGMEGFQNIQLGNVLLATLVPTLIAGIGLWILSRINANYLSWGMWITAILALLSLFLPYANAYDTPSFVSLGLMHVVVGLAVLFGLINYVWRCTDCLANE